MSIEYHLNFVDAMHSESARNQYRWINDEGES